MVVTVLLVLVLFLLSLASVQPDVLGASLHNVFASKTSLVTSEGAQGQLQSYVSGQMIVQSCLCEMGYHLLFLYPYQ
jgi:predicted PurR-regulated permease PerM